MTFLKNVPQDGMFQVLLWSICANLQSILLQSHNSPFSLQKSKRLRAVTDLHAHTIFGKKKKNSPQCKRGGKTKTIGVSLLSCLPGNRLLVSKSVVKSVGVAETNQRVDGKLSSAGCHVGFFGPVCEDQPVKGAACEEAQ